jgi:S1-C subfamily serine protease
MLSEASRQARKTRSPHRCPEDQLAGNIAPGSEVPVTVFRDGERVDVTLTLSERGAAAQSEETGIGTAADGELMGITISPVPEFVSRNLALQEGEAMMVQNVQQGSPAAATGGTSAGVPTRR